MTRIAMWSGPRNISTAMMRAWASRSDTIVCDEPLYARFLARTGAPHPGRDDIIARHETDLSALVAWLTGPIPSGKTIFYQKHMSHHLLPGDDLEWTTNLTNCFLIRDPSEMITSYIKVIPDPTPEDLGLPQQLALFDREKARLGRTPPVIDARDVLSSPRAALSALCRALEVPFDESMLHWEPGPRPTDGCWAPHWYDSVWKSTGFEPFRPKSETVPARLFAVERRCREIYDKLWHARLQS